MCAARNNYHKFTIGSHTHEWLCQDYGVVKYITPNKQHIIRIRIHDKYV